MPTVMMVDYDGPQVSLQEWCDHAVSLAVTGTPKIKHLNLDEAEVNAIVAEFDGDKQKNGLPKEKCRFKSIYG